MAKVEFPFFFLFSSQKAKKGWIYMGWVFFGRGGETSRDVRSRLPPWGGAVAYTTVEM